MNNAQLSCKCPYCEKELLLRCLEPVFCVPCKIEFSVCSRCGNIYNNELKKCPNCESIQNSINT